MPFLRNTWYVAGHADELDEKPVGRTLLDEPVVLYRTEAGEVAALGDRCPHRFAQLHKGRVVGETLQCPYHGLRFDTAGRCVHMPLGGQPPARAQVRRYPLVERYEMLFIWMGDAEAADPSTIPDLSDLIDPAIARFHFSLHARGNYQLMTDNLLDLTHAEFLHPMLASDGWAARNVATVSQSGDMITVMNVAENDNILPIMRVIKPHLNPIGTTIQRERWFAPSLLRLDIDYFTDNGEIRIPSGHFLTPETESTTHYFVLGGQTADPADAELTARMCEGVRHVFSSEDVPLIESQQDFLSGKDLIDMKPAMLSADAAAVQVRRHLARLIRQEQTAGELAAVG